MKFLFLIPGLGMNAAEYPVHDATIVLANPGFVLESGEISGQGLPENYTIEDIAKMHAQEVARRTSPDDAVTLVGFSMGGMVLSVMATEFRHLLPKSTNFIFVNTSPNLKSNPVFTSEMVASWKRLDSETLHDYFYRTMQPFFSDHFLANHDGEYKKYIEYRARGGNRQPPKDFRRQVAAILNWNGEGCFRKLNSTECRFVFAEDDKIINEAHIRDIKALITKPNIDVIPNVGHMVNVENSKIFEEILKKERSSSCSEILSVKKQP